MAPSKFQIYVDQSMRQGAVGEVPTVNRPQEGQLPPATQLPSAAYKADAQQPAGDQIKRVGGQFIDRKAYDEKQINPGPGVEYSFEELRYFEWKKKQELILMQHRREIELKRQLELADQARHYQENQPLNSSMRPPSSPPNRLSIVPQSLQPTHGDADTSCYGNLNEAPSVIQDCWKYTLQIPSNMDKFTVPIDQSQYIREHCPTSTPNNKEEKSKRSRRMSRPSVGGSPTMKLSPINETSRDCNSKSSSSSSAISTTPATVKKPLLIRPIIDEPDRPLDANDPTTFRKLLRALAEPLDRRSGYVEIDECMPDMKRHTFLALGEDNYIVGKKLSEDSNMYLAHLNNDDPDESGVYANDKSICLRVDRPANDWLFYICHELHRRLVRQKTKPDVELSVMNADPAIIYLDGSILIDEYFKFSPLEHYIAACSQLNKPFPKSMALYLALELIQVVRGLHSCDMVHMNINPRNIMITGCPYRDDLSNVDERTSVIKLIGFDRAIDTRLLPSDFKFTNKVDHMASSIVLNSKSWCHEIDWLGALNCIHMMFFLEELNPVTDGANWGVTKDFNKFPTNVWPTIFDAFMNITDIQATNALAEQVVIELSAWVKANSSQILKESLYLDMYLDDFYKATNARS